MSGEGSTEKSFRAGARIAADEERNCLVSKSLSWAGAIPTSANGPLAPTEWPHWPDERLRHTFSIRNI